MKSFLEKYAYEISLWISLIFSISAFVSGSVYTFFINTDHITQELRGYYSVYFFASSVSLYTLFGLGIPCLLLRFFANNPLKSWKDLYSNLVYILVVFLLIPQTTYPKGFVPPVKSNLSLSNFTELINSFDFLILIPAIVFGIVALWKAHETRPVIINESVEEVDSAPASIAIDRDQETVSNQG